MIEGEELEGERERLNFLIVKENEIEIDEPLAYSLTYVLTSQSLKEKEKNRWAKQHETRRGNENYEFGKETMKGKRVYSSVSYLMSLWMGME